MKRFLIQLGRFTAALICTACLAAGAILFYAAPQYSQGYNASILDKMNRLEELEDAGTPKILLVGDSNLPFGMVSSLLEEEMGMPVANLGIHGGLGFAFQENMIRGHVGKGDIIVVSNTNYAGDGAIVDHVLGWITIENHFELWKLIPKQDRIKMFEAFPKYACKALKLYLTHSGNSIEDISYCRTAFNEYGDIDYFREDRDHEMVGAVHTGMLYVNDETAQRLNDLNRYCTEQGATMVIAAYPVLKDEYTPDSSVYREKQKQLSDMLDCPVISDFTDYFFESSLFYNTAYHMTTKGAELRTYQLIDDLKNCKALSFPVR